MYASNFDNDTLNSLPRIHFTGQIVFAENENDLAHWIPNSFRRAYHWIRYRIEAIVQKG